MSGRSAAARCSVCGAPAVAVVRYARKAFCPKHYTEYIEEKVLKTIKRYRLAGPGDTVLAAVSGGKDSATLLAALAKASERLGFRLVALHIDLGLDGYSEKLLESFRRLVDEYHVPALVVSIPEITGGDNIYTLARRVRRPVCSVCGAVKRYIVNAAAVELGAKAATGHNTDDILAYAIKAFLAQDLAQVAKWAPSTPGIEGLAAPRIRPLYEVYEKESLLYAILSNTPFTHDECPHRPRRSIEDETKEYLNRLEETHPGVKLAAVRAIARKAPSYPQPQGEMVPCTICGMPSQRGICTYCRLTAKAYGEPLGPKTREYIRRLIEAQGLKPGGGQEG